MIDTFESSFLDFAVNLSLAFLLIAMLVTFVRIGIGPTLPDRVIALDLLSVLLVCFMALFTLITEVGAYLDVAVSLALVAFLSTIAFARFTERRLRQEGPGLSETGVIVEAIPAADPSLIGKEIAAEPAADTSIVGKEGAADHD